MKNLIIGLVSFEILALGLQFVHQNPYLWLGIGPAGFVVAIIIGQWANLAN